MSDVHVELTATEVYAHAAVSVRAWSQAEFELELSGVKTTQSLDILSCAVGDFDGPGSPRVGARLSDGRWTVQCEVVGAFRENPISRHGKPEGPQSTLGVRWYPFVAARLSLCVTSPGHQVASVTLSLGVGLRLRGGYAIESTIDPDKTLPRRNRLEENAWSHTVWWPEGEGRETVRLDLPLQTATHDLARRMYGAAAGLVLVLTAIAVGGQLENGPQIVSATLAAYFLLLVRHWSDVPRAHHSTAMAAIYLTCGALTIPWALGWGHGDSRTWCELVVIVPWLAVLLATVPYFESTGRPPPVFAVPWRALSRGLEVSRDTVRDPWRLAGVFAEFDAARAMAEPTENEVRFAVGNPEGPDRDEVTISLVDYAFEVRRRGGAKTEGVTVWSGWGMLRAVERAGIDPSAVRKLVERRNEAIRHARSVTVTDEATARDEVCKDA